tara:strand:+ start:11411 stop:11620 length:210 start_codon:yes stop_codon:yes gene_type:complete
MLKLNKSEERELAMLSKELFNLSPMKNNIEYQLKTKRHAELVNRRIACLLSNEALDTTFQKAVTKSLEK